MESLWGSRDSWKEKRSCFLKIENLDNEAIFFQQHCDLGLACTWEDTRRCMNLLFHLNQRKSFYHKKVIWYNSENFSVWYRIRPSQIRFSGPCSVNSKYLQGQRCPALFGLLFHLIISMEKKKKKTALKFHCSYLPPKPLILLLKWASHLKRASLPSSCMMPLWVLSFRLKNQHPPPFPTDHVLHQLGDFLQTGWSRMSVLTRSIASGKFKVCW